MKTSQQEKQFFPYSDYLALKHWPFWFLCGLLWLSSRLSLKNQWRIAGALGYALSFLPIRSKVVRVNLDIAFPDKTPQEKNKIFREVYQHSMCWLFEIGNCWYQDPEWWHKNAEIQGLEHIELARKEQGVMLVLPHFSCLELMGALMTQCCPMHITYAEARYTLFNEYQKFKREQFCKSTIERKDIRLAVRRLRDKDVIWYSPDQSARRENGGVDTRYFNHPVLTVSATSRLAAIGKAKVLPCYGKRDLLRGKIILEFRAALDNFPTDDAQQDAQRLNTLFEEMINQSPEQYFWLHKRFKPTDPSHPDPYN